MAEYSEGDIVEIRFRDLQQVRDWTPIEEARKSKPPVCKIVGYLLEETSDTVILTGAISDDDECDYWIFPRGCIINVRKIEDSELDDFKTEE